MNPQKCNILGILFVVMLGEGNNGNKTIVEYATFEDPDMLDLCPLPVPHVGVIAKLEYGSLWIIHNNGNGTIAMNAAEYDYNWNDHKLRISHWSRAVDQSTVEGAVQSGSTKYDLILDNCYNARDAVVKYLSKGETTITLKVCQPHQLYCGYQLDARHLNAKSVTVINVRNSLFKCREDGFGVDFIITCVYPCISRDGTAFCKCLNGKNCGHELNAAGVPGDYVINHLYSCDNSGQNVTHIMSCPGSCIALTSQSLCAGKCEPNKHYCGYQLRWLGWTENMGWAMNNTLYICSEDGSNVTELSVCKGRCLSTVSAGDHCPCIPNQTYCGHELYVMGWSYEEYKPVIGSERNKLGRCTTGSNVEWLASCSECGRKDGEAICTCLPGQLYCGSELVNFGWKGYDNNTLYVCGDTSDNDTVLSTCTSGVCTSGSINSHCDCVPGTAYCYHNLAKNFGWWNGRLESKYEKSYGICVNGTHTKWLRDCTHGCISHESGDFCGCKRNHLYCGHEIDITGTAYNNDTLYKCYSDEYPYITATKMCNSSCAHVEDSWDSYCSHECIPNTTFCGSRGNSLGWNGLDNGTLYICSEDGENLSAFSINSRLCNLCIPGNTYCGHDLQQIQVIGPTEMESLYVCGIDHKTKFAAHCTAGCQPRANGNAYCLNAPMAWYWLAMVTVLPVVCLALVAYLAYTIVKHKRLQKFLRQHRIDASQLIVTKKLGNGQFGEVFMADYKATDGSKTLVALKISKRHFGAISHWGLASADCFFQESVALDFLRHKNITKALGICSNFKDDNGKTSPALVLEYMNGGNSIDYILAEKTHLTERDLKRILVDVSQAGSHMRKMGVVHRDLRACNVLIQKDDQSGKPIAAKLTDFGLAKDIGKTSGLYQITNPDRTMFHKDCTAPEGFKGEFCSQSDVWSFGVFMWEIYTLMDPKQNKDPAPYYDLPGGNDKGALVIELAKGFRLRKPCVASDAIYEIMMECWQFKPESRPTFDNLVKIFSTMKNRDLQAAHVTAEYSRKTEVEPVSESELSVEEPATGDGYVYSYPNKYLHTKNKTDMCGLAMPKLHDYTTSS